MPRLPTDGIFSVDELLERGPNTIPDIAQWQWRDDGGRWHPYSMWDSRLIEVILKKKTLSNLKIIAVQQCTEVLQSGVVLKCCE